MNRLLLVDYQKRSLVSQTNSMYQIVGFGRDSTLIEDLGRLPAVWEREIIFHCKSILHLGILYFLFFSFIFVTRKIEGKQPQSSKKQNQSIAGHATEVRPGTARLRLCGTKSETHLA